LGGSYGSWDGTQYTGLLGLVQKGRNGGTWDGLGGIITSQINAASPRVLTTLACMTAADAGFTTPGTFRGVSVVPTDVLTAYTWGGDANLDRTINGDDYFQIGSNVGR